MPCQTRIELLDAAEALFSANGYDAVGIREIAQQAGTNIASIKYHFGSKHELYLQTVSRAMTRPQRHGSCEREDGDADMNAWQMLREATMPRRKLDAAALLARFIRQFLAQLLPEAGDDACGMLIIREGMQPSEALDSVVNQYIRPNQTLLVDLLRVIKPEADAKELSRDAQSILGQLLHYRVFRAIMEKLRGHNLSEPKRLDELARHLTRFSLRGLGCNDDLIDRALELMKPPHRGGAMQGHAV